MQGLPLKWQLILCHGHQQPSVGQYIRQEIADIVHQSYKPLNIIIGPGNTPFLDPIKLCNLRVDTLIIYYVAKALYMLSIQFTLLPFEVQLILA